MSNGTKFLGSEVRLVVADLDRALRFYRDVLGFACDSLWPPESPDFAILSRDDVRLQLSVEERCAGCGTAWFDVGGVLRLHARIEDRVEIEWGPEVYDYGRREFGLRDPSGNLVILSESVEDRRP